MILKNIFRKPVDRPIEGVIKADDEASLKLEVEEYVLTNEIEKRLEVFLDSYNNYDNANGVWISGFFGSGKSHLLKLLAMLLENREVEGNLVLDEFLDKSHLFHLVYIFIGKKLNFYFFCSLNLVFHFFPPKFV